MEWHYSNEDDEESAGPVSVDDLKDLYRRKVIDKTTSVWNEDFEDWKTIKECPDLLRKIAPAKKKPPPRRKIQKKSAPPTRKITSRPKDRATASTKMSDVSSSSSSDRANRRAEKARALEAQSSSTWEERSTLDGMPYYYNSKTDALTWDKPDALKSRAEKRQEASDWCWVADEEEGWIAKRGKGEWTFTKSELTRLEQDIVMLDHINEAQIVHNIRARYKINKIYTWCGASKTVLISINPFKMLPLYTPKVIQDHRRPPPNKSLEPHVYDIANNALNAMTLEGKNQSILISGESGAGKTECAKQCFSFLAACAGSDSNVEQLILSANPLLESFGNAKTLRNNNSSRFGKWVAIDFDVVGKIASAKAESFLLEKSRVVRPAKGERNFHIFYQLFSSSRHREKYGLEDPSKFRYLANSECFVVDGIDDAKDFEEMQQAMTLLGFSAPEQSWVFDTVAAILHLGTIKFKKKRIKSADGCEIKTRSRLKQTASLFHVTPEALEKCLTNRSIKVGVKKTFIPLKPEEALDACDALAKGVYKKLFEWLVKRVNDATKEKSGDGRSKGKKGNFIGVLDIFGFEIFEKNSFEQLCINYCNEKLQQFFNKHTFKEEESVYVRECVPYTKIQFIDNQPVLDLIERKRKGILPLLDDEIRLPKGSHESYMRRVDDANKSMMPPYKTCKRIRNSKKSTLYFAIVHYAGEVQYTSKGFMEKNKDSLYDELSVTMSGSSSKFMKDVFPKKGGRTRKTLTISERFRKQLSDLMKMLNKTEPLYIRCIKPNHQKRSDTFVPPMCIEQLKNAGVFEAVTIRKSGYPFRFTHKQFASRFRCTLLQKDMSWKRITARPPMWREMCEQLLDEMPCDVSGVQIGKTMCLYRAKEHRLLSLMRHLALERVVPTCQRVMRGHLAREFKRRMLRVGKKLKAAIDKHELDALEDAIGFATKTLGPLRDLFDFEPKLLAEAVQIKRELKWKLEADFAKMALRQAIEENDPIKRINREIYLEMHQLDVNRSFFVFHKYMRLRDPMDYAYSSWKFWGREALADGMLRHTTNPIHTSLTRLDSAAGRSEAKLAFRNILAYMGDNGTQAESASLAVELMEIGLNGDENMRTEIFCQIIKQLIGNKSPASEKRGWDLMAVAVSCLRPSDDFHGYLIIFLQTRKDEGKPYVSAFHETKYGKPKLPNASNIQSIVDGVEDRVDRSRYSAQLDDDEDLAAATKQSSRGASHKATTKKKKKTTRSKRRKDHRKTPLYAAQNRISAGKPIPDDDDDDDDSPPPPAPVRREEESGPTMIAGYDFEPMDDTMIAMKEGDTMVLIGEEESGWTRALNKRTGMRGYVPMNYLE